MEGFLPSLLARARTTSCGHHQNWHGKLYTLTRLNHLCSRVSAGAVFPLLFHKTSMPYNYVHLAGATCNSRTGELAPEPAQLVSTLFWNELIINSKSYHHGLLCLNFLISLIYFFFVAASSHSYWFAFGHHGLFPMLLLCIWNSLCFHIYLCVCVYRHIHAFAHLWRSENNLQGLWILGIEVELSALVTNTSTQWVTSLAPRILPSILSLPKWSPTGPQCLCD